MAKTWQGIEKQINKIKTVTQDLTPPVPDDEFETARRFATEALNTLERYCRIRHTGVPEDVE